MKTIPNPYGYYIDKTALPSGTIWLCYHQSVDIWDDRLRTVQNIFHLSLLYRWLSEDLKFNVAEWDIIRRYANLEGSGL